MTPMIEFERVSRRFVRQQRAASVQERFIGLLRGLPTAEEFFALRDVSFRIAAGESFGLVGHNGAGKSTLLKLMTRVLAASSGTVRTRGRIAALIELGSGFHPDLTGRENVFLYGSLMGINRYDLQARLPEIIEFSEIGAFLDTPVKHYSSGMYTRLAFSVATAVDPDVLITDEVLAVGDEAFQRKCEERIFRFRRAGKTIVYVSHALNTVEALCDTAIWLDHGEMQHYGPAGEVVARYLHYVNSRHRDGMTSEAMLAAQQGRPLTINGIELCNAQGDAVTMVESHGALTVRLHYQAVRPVEQPIFAVSIHHEDGRCLSGQQLPLTTPISGSGTVEYRIESLPLQAGRYRVFATAAADGVLPQHRRNNPSCALAVEGQGSRLMCGMIALRGSWQHNG